MKMDAHQRGTLCIMALVGMSLYTTTYALVYATTLNATVPVLEMWMITTHMACAIVSLFFHVIGVEDENIASSIFLGVACSMTILGNDCIQYGNCALYFGAATLPRIAAAGAIAWVWIMYVSSFNSLPDTFIAALLMSIVPLAVEAKTLLSCSDKWQPLLQGPINIWIRVAVSAALMSGSCFIHKVFLLGHPIVMWAMQPHDATVTASPLSYYMTIFAFVLISFFNKKKRPQLRLGKTGEGRPA